MEKIRQERKKEKDDFSAPESDIYQVTGTVIESKSKNGNAVYKIINGKEVFKKGTTIKAYKARPEGIDKDTYFYYINTKGDVNAKKVVATFKNLSELATITQQIKDRYEHNKTIKNQLSNEKIDIVIHDADGTMRKDGLNVIITNGDTPVTTGEIIRVFEMDGNKNVFYYKIPFSKKVPPKVVRKKYNLLNQIKK